MGGVWTDPLCALQGWLQGLSAPDLAHPPAWASPARPLMPEDDDVHRNPPCGLSMSEPPWCLWNVNKEGVSLTYAPPVLSLMHPSPRMTQVGVGPGCPACHTYTPYPPTPNPTATPQKTLTLFSQEQGARPSLPGPSAGSLCISQQGRPLRGVGSHWLCSRATCQWCGPVTGVGRGVGGFLSPERQASHYVSIVALPASLSAVLRLILHIEA